MCCCCRKVSQQNYNNEAVRVCRAVCVCVQRNVQSCFVNKIQCCCCCCCLFMPVFKKSFLLLLLPVVRCLAIIWVVLQQRQTQTQIPAHTLTHTHTYPHTPSLGAHVHIITLCTFAWQRRRNQCETLYCVYAACATFIRGVALARRRHSDCGTAADVCNMLPCYVVNVAFYYFTHIPVRVCVCVGCHQLSLFQTSLSFCFIYISTTRSPLPHCHAIFYVMTVRQTIRQQLQLQLQQQQQQEGQQQQQGLVWAGECVTVTFRGSYFALIFNDVDFYN